MRIQARAGREGIDLKDAVLAMGQGHDVIGGLGKLGYRGELIKESTDSKEFHLSRKDGE